LNDVHKKAVPCWKIQLKPAEAGWLVLAGLNWK